MKHLISLAAKRLSLAVVFFFTIMACNTKRLENTKELSKEIKASQIKRVTNTQLIYTIDEWGKKISKIAEKTLQKEFSEHPEKAGEICSDLSKIQLIAALQKEYGVTIQLLGEKDVKNQELDPKEKELLEAYLYSAKTSAAASDNVQQVNDTLFVYNVPVAANNAICKTCMPDQETPFAVWRLLFDKKEIIRKLDAKQLKE
jgi:hypothetical protein